MVARIQLGMLAAVALFALVLGFNSAFAQEKKAEKATSKCATCAEVHKVLEAARCEGCAKADKQCAKCAEASKKMEEKLDCKACDKSGKSCPECEAAMKGQKCDFCAARHYIVTHEYCCGGCEKKGYEASEKCAKCEDMRKAVANVECPKDHKKEESKKG